MNKTAARCDLCGGELRPGTTTLEIWQGEELIVIKDVAAEVCQECREAYISAAVSEKLDRFLAEYQRVRPQRYMAVPQYAAAQALA